MTASPSLASFEKLKVRYVLEADLVAKTGLRVGAGKSLDAAATNLPIMRDALGRPFIPGSSVKGVLRSGLESALRGLGSPALRACDPFAALADRSEPVGYDPDRDHLLRTCERTTILKRDADGRIDSSRELGWILENTCTVCGLFGSPSLGGRVFVHDLPMVGVAHTEVRDGVGLDRDLGTAATGAKYDVEVVPPGTRFGMELLLENVDEIQLALVLRCLRMLDEGELLLGGMTSRGLGRVKVDQPKLKRTTARRLLTGEGFEELDLQTEEKVVVGRLPEILNTRDEPGQANKADEAIAHDDGEES